MSRSPADDLCQKAVKAFCNRVMEINNIYHIQEQIYKYATQTELFQEVANNFFYDVYRSLVNLLLLEMVKISEKPGKGGNENLTVSYLAKNFDWSEENQDRLNKLEAEIAAFNKKIFKARHKVIAHNDVSTIIEEKVYGEFPFHEGVQFLENLKQVCDICHKECFGIIFGMMIVTGPGDIHSCIDALSKSITFDELFEEANTEDKISLFDKSREVRRRYRVSDE